MLLIDYIKKNTNKVLGFHEVYFTGEMNAIILTNIHSLYVLMVVVVEYTTILLYVVQN